MNDVMYFYKLTLRNGLVYYIQDKDSDLNNFMTRIAKEKHWTDFILAKPNEYKNEFMDKSIKCNVVMLRVDEIIAVEYSLNL